MKIDQPKTPSHELMGIYKTKNFALKKGSGILSPSIPQHGASGGHAVQVAGYPLDKFIELLSGKNIPVIDYPVEDLKEDILNA